MDTPTQQINDYRAMTREELRMHMRSFIAGCIVTTAVFLILISRIPREKIASTLNLPKRTEGIDASKDVLSIAQKLQNTQETSRLSVPTKGPTPAGELVVEGGQISAIQSGQVTYKKNVYIVQEGDSLASIAEKTYGDSNAWTTIAKANNLSSPDQIEVGMELKIPR